MAESQDFHLSSHAPPAEASTSTRAGPERDTVRWMRAVQGDLRSRGVWMREQWLESCLSGLAAGRAGFGELDTARQAESCFHQVLMADFNVAGAGCLPLAMHGIHKRELEGPFVLQVDEIVDVGSALRDRFKEKQKGRCLKLSMTDGKQRIFALEYRFVPALQVLPPAGFKVVVRNVQVRRGLLLLVPEVVDVLGGFVERLEAARLRVVQEVNKPPRGKRQGDLASSLPQMASAAAWPVEESITVHDAPSIPSNESVPRSDSATAPQAVSQMPTASVAQQRLDSQETSGNNSLPLPRRKLCLRKRSDWCEQGASQPGSSSMSSDAVAFTYLASLREASMSQSKSISGRVKGFIVGVKEFSLTQLGCKLIVHVDDGSFITEALITETVVLGVLQSLAAQSSSQNSTSLKSAMTRENRQQLQAFLSRFEGFIDIELSRLGEMPFVTKLTEDFSTRDAWSLLHRVSKAMLIPQNNGRQKPQVIELLSP